jgi:methylamine dehydrogenase heavy chain
MFVTMHPDGSEGSHKDAAEEVWAYKMGDKALQYRSHVDEPVSIAVTPGEDVVLFAVDDENGVMKRYEVDPEAKFAAKLAGTAEELGDFAPLVIAPQ